VVVGGMITSPLAILFVIPVLASYWLPSPSRTSAKAAADADAPAT
jgi:Cu/Ag efflux pump CusA